MTTKEVVMQARIKKPGCIWRDNFVYGPADDIRYLDAARLDLERYKPGSALGDSNYFARREWRVAIKETIIHVIDQH